MLLSLGVFGKLQIGFLTLAFLTLSHQSVRVVTSFSVHPRSAARIRPEGSSLVPGTARTTLTLASAVLGDPTTASEENTAFYDDAIDSSLPSSLGAGISHSIEELAAALGGLGRARLVWDCYSIGIDPALYFGDTELLQGPDSDLAAIQNALPTCRNQQRLGPDALAKLAALYSQATSTADHNDGATTVTRLEGGLATLVAVHTSRDGTTKLLLRLADGLEIETVIIPWNDSRSTLCVSSQVGCRQGCRFCATGRMGKLRSLTTDEILAQMFYARKLCRQRPELLPPISNVVFMGMGDAGDNLEAVRRACVILTTRELFQLSSARVTVSTVGPSPATFTQLTANNAPCVLAWSVHAARDDLRRRLVPTTRYTMAELTQGLIDALLQRAPRKSSNGRTAMLEVTLLEDVNDSIREADELADLCRTIREGVPGCKLVVNLIPYNPHLEELGDSLTASYQRPSPDRVRAFQERLWERGQYAHIRTTRGDETLAACGQLATSSSRRKTPTSPKKPASSA